jgi:hypothetical protein
LANYSYIPKAPKKDKRKEKKKAIAALIKEAEK